MFKRNILTLTLFLRSLLALGLLLSSASLAQAAKKPAKVLLPQLEKEERTVFIRKHGKQPGLQQKKLKVHALYATPTMDAFVDVLGDLYIQPKVSSKGNLPCGTIGVLPKNYADREDGRKNIIRKLLSVKTMAKPSRSPRSLKLDMEFADGVKSTVEYSFDGKKIETEMVTVDPKEIKSPSKPRITASIPPSHDIAIDASMAEKKKATKDCMLLLKTDKYGYADFVKASHRDGVSSASIVGPWPGAKIKLGGRPGVRMWVYPGSMLYEGYQMIANDADSPKKKIRLSIEVEKGR